MIANKLPLVSVIVPIYRIERYLGFCIESLLNQEYENLEIILVDDGSPDRCPEICDLYAKKDKRITVIHKPNGGLVSARKAGLAVSKGKYISNVDGDDWVAPDFISSLMEVILISDSDAVVGGYERVFFGQTKKLHNMLSSGVYEGERLDSFFHEMISIPPYYNFGVFTYLWNKIFKREVLLEAQMNVDNRISIGEDGACTYPALLQCKRVVVTNSCAYYYRQREDSMLKKSVPFIQEAPTIKILYEYMSKAMPEMQAQIDDYVLSIFIIRSGGIVPGDNNDMVPFNENIRNKRVAIYSAGTFGQQLKVRLTENDFCKVVAWFDDDYWEYRRCCLDVDPVESVKEVDFDYLLIASTNQLTAESIRTQVCAHGVEEAKVLSINIADKESVLQAYLKN